MNERSTGRGVGQAYLLFAASLLLVLTVGGAVQVISFTAGLAATELLLILGPTLLFLRWKRLPVAEALRWRRVPIPVALLGLAVGIGGWGVAAGIQLLLAPVLGVPAATPGLAARSWPDLLPILGVAAILPALCEEALFRGVIQGVLSRRGAARAVVVTALLFGVYHVSPWSVVPALFLGLVFGSVVERTGSTVPSMLAHAGNNATAVIVSFVLADRPESTAHVLMAVLAVGFCAASAAFWWCTRGAAPAPSPLAAVPAQLSRAVLWINGGAAAVVALGATAVIIAAVSQFDLHTVSGDHLEPAIHAGDRLVLSTRNLESATFASGQIIAVRRDGDVAVRWVARVDGETIWIKEDSGEQAITRDRIVGRVIHRIPGGKSSAP